MGLVFGFVLISSQSVAALAMQGMYCKVGADNQKVSAEKVLEQQDVHLSARTKPRTSHRTAIPDLASSLPTPSELTAAKLET